MNDEDKDKGKEPWKGVAIPDDTSGWTDRDEWAYLNKKGPWWLGCMLVVVVCIIITAIIVIVSQNMG